MNQKGGCGKTTTAVNLAGSLRARGRRVLVVDMDPQAHATLGLNGNMSEPVRETVHEPLLSRGSLEPALITVLPGLDLAPSGDSLFFAERDLGFDESGEERLLQCLRATPRTYDYVLVDCPPSLGALTFNALRACDEVIIPVEVGFFSLNGVGNFLRALRRYRRSWLSEKRIRALVTMYDKQTNFAREVLTEMEQFFGDALYRTRIHRNVKIKEASSFGVPIIEYDPAARGSLDYLALADEVIGEEAAERRAAPGLMLTEVNDDRSTHSAESGPR